MEGCSCDPGGATIEKTRYVEQSIAIAILNHFARPRQQWGKRLAHLLLVTLGNFCEPLVEGGSKDQPADAHIGTLDECKGCLRSATRMPEHSDTCSAPALQPFDPGDNLIGSIAMPVIVLKLAIEHALAPIDAETQGNRQRVQPTRFQVGLKGGNHLHPVMRQRAMHNEDCTMGRQCLARRQFEVTRNIEAEVLGRNRFAPYSRDAKPDNSGEQCQKRSDPVHYASGGPRHANDKPTPHTIVTANTTDAQPDAGRPCITVHRAAISHSVISESEIGHID